MPVYSKPFLSVAKQVALLKQRGLQIDDENFAEECLSRNGYYRLSAYWYPFRTQGVAGGKRTDVFLPGSRFEDAQQLYVFDKDLKLLLMDAIERVEIAARVGIALRLGPKATFPHQNPHLFEPWFVNPAQGGQSRHQQWLQKLNGQILKSNEEFVAHHHRTYGVGSPLPIWIEIELWDFGLLSHLFSGMRLKDTRAIALRLGVPDPRLLRSWLRSLNYVRNVIAHHGRLWNSKIVERPGFPSRAGVIPAFDALLPYPNSNSTVYGSCCILAYLSRVINPQSQWHKKLVASIKTFPVMPHTSVSDMGFPPNWESHDFWN